MITDEDAKNLIDELYRKWNFFRKQAENTKNTPEERAYFEGMKEGIDRCIDNVEGYNNRQLKGFSSAVYGKKVAKEAKKNPKKAGKKMEQAFRNMF